MSRLSHLFSAVTLRLARAVVCALPPHSLPTVARMVGLAWYAWDGRRRLRAAENLRVAFGPDRSEAATGRFVRSVFCHMARVPLEVLWCDRLLRTDRQVRRRCRFHGDWPRAPLTTDDSQGGVVFFGHLGGWEVLIRVVRLRLGRFRVVVRSIDNSRVDALATHTRGGGDAVIRKRGARAELVDSLREGYWVGLAADQNAGLRGIFVPFFGLAASTWDTPARLALTEGVPLDLVTAVRGPGRELGFDVHRERVAAPRSGTPTDEQVAALTADLHARLEAWIRRTPEQYNFLHRRWKDRPPDETPGPHLPRYDHHRQEVVPDRPGGPIRDNLLDRGGS